MKGMRVGDGLHISRLMECLEIEYLGEGLYAPAHWMPLNRISWKSQSYPNFLQNSIR